jgi:hypothetical protein
MLCDEWLARVEEGASRRHAPPELVEHAREIRGMLSAASRFVLAPDAFQLVSDLVETTTPAAFDKARRQSVAPAEMNWIEWFCPKRGTRVGFLLHAGPGSAHALGGVGYVVMKPLTNTGERDIFFLPITWDLPGPEPALTVDPTWAEDPRVHADFPGVKALFDDALAMTYVLSFALIATPRVAKAAFVDHEKINRKRRKLGRSELLTHSEISLALGPTTEKSVASGGEAEARSGVARHHVRAHYRFVHGKIALVRHHMRGDASVGHVRQRFTLRAT